MLDGEVVASDAEGARNLPGCTCAGPDRAISTFGHSTYLPSTAVTFVGNRWKKRRACLQALLERFGSPAVSLSEPFEDGLALLRGAGLEGVSNTLL